MVYRDRSNESLFIPPITLLHTIVVSICKTCKKKASRWKSRKILREIKAKPISDSNNWLSEFFGSCILKPTES